MIAGTAAVMLISTSHGQRTWESPHRTPATFLQAPGLAGFAALFGPASGLALESKYRKLAQPGHKRRWTP